jgi:hypothetical protein
MPIAYIGNRTTKPWAVKTGGSGTGAMTVPTEFFFPTTTARDTYFTANPGRLRDQILCAVGTSPNYSIYQYDAAGTIWNAITPVFVGPAGADGKNPEFRFAEDTLDNKYYLQYRLQGTSAWTNLLEQDDLRGNDGKDGVPLALAVRVSDIDLTPNTLYIQWKYTIEPNSMFRDLVKLDDLKGDQGDPGDPGDPGKKVLLRVNSTHVQWQHEGDSVWQDLVLLSNIGAGTTGGNGEDGDHPELRVGTDNSEQWIQWRLSKDTGPWNNIIKVSDLKGAKGDAGDSVALRVNAGEVQWKTSSATAWTKLIDVDDITGANGLDGSPGTNGKSPEFQTNTTTGYIQWRYANDPTDTTWKNLTTLASITGAAGTNGTDGREIELRVNSGKIQWSYKNSGTWTDLVTLASLTGAKGDSGDTPEFRANSTKQYIQWRYTSQTAETDWKDLVAYSVITGEDGENGTNGKTPEVRVDSGKLQWRYTEDAGTWTDLFTISSLDGEDGKTPELRVDTTTQYIQWKYTTDATWTNLIALADLKGAKGDPGDPGNDGDPGEDGKDGKSPEFQVGNDVNGTTAQYIQWRYASASDSWKNLLAVSSITGGDGANGSDGKTPTLRVDSGKLQWAYTEDLSTPAETWTDILAIADLKGAKGDPGDPGDPGDDGDSPELRVGEDATKTTTDQYIQWKLSQAASTAWQNIIAVADLTGEDGEDGDPGDPGKDGKSPELQVNASTQYIQWRWKTSDNSDSWKDLISLEDLKGEKGDSAGSAASDGFIDFPVVNPDTELIVNLCSFNKNLDAFRRLEVITPQYQYTVTGEIKNGSYRNKFTVDGMMYEVIPKEVPSYGGSDGNVRDKLYFISPTNASDEMMVWLKTSKEYKDRLRYKVFIGETEKLIEPEDNGPILLDNDLETAAKTFMSGISGNTWGNKYLSKGFFRIQESANQAANESLTWEVDTAYQEVNFGMHYLTPDIDTINVNDYKVNTAYLLKLRNQVLVNLDIDFKAGAELIAGWDDGYTPAQPLVFDVFKEDSSAAGDYAPILTPFQHDVILYSDSNEIAVFGTLAIKSFPNSSDGISATLRLRRDTPFVVPAGKVVTLKTQFTYMTH